MAYRTDPSRACKAPLIMNHLPEIDMVNVSRVNLEGLNYLEPCSGCETSTSYRYLPNRVPLCPVCADGYDDASAPTWDRWKEKVRERIAQLTDQYRSS